MGFLKASVTLRKIECFRRARAGIVYHGITKWLFLRFFGFGRNSAWLIGTVGGIRIEQSEVKFLDLFKTN